MKRCFLTLLLLVVAAAFPGSARADSSVSFNEIMYHSANNETLLEWVELRNQMAVDVDISGWSITGGIQYTFASNTIVRGGGFKVVALSPVTMIALTGSTNIVGPFLGRLSNNGDTLRLRNNSGRAVDEVSYGVEGDWPVAPDGSGVSLAKRDEEGASGHAANWTASEQVGGTPAARNFTQTTGFVAPSGLVSYWNFNEPSGVSASDQAGQNHGTLGNGVTRVASTVGRALSFNGLSNAYVNVGAGNNNNFAVSGGITIEAVLSPGWSSTNSAVIFKKAPRRPGNYRDAVLTNNPIAYWRLGDATTAIIDTTVNARNGTATPGVLLNQPSLIPSDPANGAIRAGGTDRITVNGFEKIGAGGYSVEYWVKVNALPVGCCQNLVGDGEASGDYYMMNYILGPPQGLPGAVRPHYGPGNTPVSMDSTTALQAGGTYHIVTTWDTGPAANNAVIYINGVANRVGTISRNVPAAGTTGANRVYIGKDDRDTSDGNNTLDEVAIYNYPLSAGDVAAHYAAGITTNFDLNLGNAVQFAFQNDGNNGAANPPVAVGPVLSFGLTVGGAYSELDLPLDGAAGRPTLAGLENGQPHHVAATYNSANGLKAIYVDGVLRFSTTLSGAVNANNGADAILGNSETNGATPFVGTLDEMAYWSRALSAAEVAAHASAMQAGRDYFAPTSQVVSTTLAFNELSASTNAEFWLELLNYGTSNIPLAGYVIVRDGAVDNEYVFPSGPSINAGGYRAVTNTTLGFHPVDGDKLYLLPPARDKVIDAVVLKQGPRARSPEATGPFLRPSAPSPGGANTFAFHNEIVINEIMYHPHALPPTNGQAQSTSKASWLELYNKSGGPVDLTGWSLGGGISYNFSPGQMLAAGAYLVVAKDAAYLRALYPAINIVGDFSGDLSHRSDSITLKDASANPADELRYHGSGRWPEFADGGGSSLELRDPNADNSQGEAWAASDETSKSSWQNYSYKLVAGVPAGNNQPTVWNEFILGLLADGECLIDDLTVVESPATAPVQMVANGDFENGLTGWRVLGTHVRSRVETEPGNPGNHVLHVSASGPQEHMHNHIETSTIAYRPIVATREYQVSYRARWLAGNNLVNTRLYFNRSARTTALPVPSLNGTPGAQNSRYAGNIGPAFSQFQHRPVIPQPGQPVTVSVSATDPQGVASAEVWWSANGGAWTSAAMSAQGGGGYSGTIPGFASPATVQFYVRAVDGLGAAATYPASGTNSGALYSVSDGQANLSLGHNIRIILTTANTDLLHASTNVMSNDRLPGTVVYDESRAYYNVGVRLKGSQRGRPNSERVSYHVEFPPEDPFRGVHPFMLVDRSGAGDTAANKQQEILIKHILLRAGDIPGTQPDMCRVIAPRTAHTGPALLSPRHEDEFVETAYENGGDGSMWELELIYYPNAGQTNQFGYKFVTSPPNNDSVLSTDISNLGDDKEFYRYNFIIKNHRDEDDYSRFITFAKTFSIPTGPLLEAQAQQVMDVNEWTRAYALESLCGVGDSYTFGNNHNLFMYSRPSDDKFVAFPVDMDFSFNRSSTATLIGDQNLSVIFNLPANRRCFYAHVLDIIATSYNTSYMTYWVNHYQSFAPGQNYQAVLTTYMPTRITTALNEINGAGGNAAFAVSGPATITTSNNLVTLSGTAPVQVKTICINGREYEVTWTSVSGWTIRVPVSEATNVLNIVGYDLGGNILTNFSRTNIVIYTGPVPDPAGRVVINEIMYNPIAPEASYVELINTSTNLSFDLSGWRLNGMDFTFPDGSILTNRGFLVVANSMPGYVAAYGTNVPVPLATYGGQLQNDGETLTLLRPGAVPGQDIEVDKVRYESVRPWPTTPNGTGPSLQLIDATQDNSRPSAWAAGGAWTKVTRTANISTATNLLLWLPAAGNCFIDDISLIATNADATNIVLNGNFESALSGPWILPAIYSTSYITNGVAHSGNGSLFINGTAGGSGLNVIQQWIGPRVPINMNCTLSYWILLNTNVVTVRMRTLPGSAIDTTGIAQSIIATPGVNNSFAESLPPYDPLWLNELQASNVAGLTDNFGDRDPWVEIYNGGSNTVSLDGYFLADNYGTNLQQWPFPSGVTVGPGQFKIVWVDGEAQETVGVTHLHANFRLPGTTGTVALVRSVAGTAQITDYLTYAGLGAGRSYGDYPDGQPFTRQEFYQVTPGTANNNTAPPLVVFINEWMAANTSTLLNTNHNNEYDDWFELYNPGNSPANLAGYFLTDNLSNKFQFAIPPGFVIPPHSFKLVWADGAPSLNDTNNPDLHVSFKLAQNGEHIGLFAIDGTLIDAVVFEPQFNNVSQGRFPDGPTTNYFLAAPTPRASNTIWINRCPTLDPIPDATAYLDTLFTFTAVGADPDAPPQTLVYSLDNPAPTNASVHPITGAFAWTPTATQTPGTNVLTLRVTDNGPLALSAARTFTVITRVPLLLGGMMVTANGNFEFTVGAVVGKTYRVEFKDALDAAMWTPLGPDRVATSTALIITDNIGANPHRFYQVLLLD